MQDLKHLFSFSSFLNEKILIQEKKEGGGGALPPPRNVRAAVEGTAVSRTRKYWEERTGSWGGHYLPKSSFMPGFCQQSLKDYWLGISSSLIFYT